MDADSPSTPLGFKLAGTPAPGSPAWARGRALNRAALPRRAQRWRGSGLAHRCRAERPLAAGGCAVLRGPPLRRAPRDYSSPASPTGSDRDAYSSPAPLPLVPGLRHRAHGRRWITQLAWAGWPGLRRAGQPAGPLASRSRIATDRAHHEKVAQHSAPKAFGQALRRQASAVTWPLGALWAVGT